MIRASFISPLADPYNWSAVGFGLGKGEEWTELTQGFQNSGQGFADTLNSDDKHFLRRLLLTLLDEQSPQSDLGDYPEPFQLLLSSATAFPALNWNCVREESHLPPPSTLPKTKKQKTSAK